MSKKIFYLLKAIITILLLTTNSFGRDLSIIPLKKPILDKITVNERISKSIIKPKSKPKKNEPKKIIEKVEIVKKDNEKINFLIPKNKPLVVKKEKSKVQKKSKYYNKKDFSLAKQSILAFEKGNWKSALSLSKKAKDKSIYNFIQWKHLLTTGNQASFYDYKLFIDKNESAFIF